MHFAAFLEGKKIIEVCPEIPTRARAGGAESQQVWEVLGAVGMSQLSPGGDTCSQQGMVALPAPEIVINPPGKGLLVSGDAEGGGTLAEFVPISCSTRSCREGSSHSLLS